MESAAPQPPPGKTIGGKKPRAKRTPEQLAAAREKREATKRKEREALELRTAGHGWQEIADQLGYANASGPWKAVDRILAKQIREPAETLIALELVRLDAMLKAIFEKILLGDLGAIDRGLRIMERRAKLLGLDRPMKFDVRSMVDEIAAEFGLDADEKAAVHTDVEQFLALAAKPE